MKENQLPYYIVITALFLGVVSPGLLSHGMFFDGVTYAAVSRNLAHGLGSFWDLQYTATLYPHFHEHPPLAFAMQGLFFRILGDSFLVERIYSLATFFVTGFIIIRTWNLITERAYGYLAWLPLLFWLLVPLVTWSASNNILENSLMIFTGLSVLFFIKSLTTNRLLNLSAAGLMLFFGCLTKGFVALFPLSLPLWLFLFKPGGQFRSFVMDTLILLLAILVPFVVMFVLMPESKGSLVAYVNKQVVGSLTSIQTVQSRFYILWRLFGELLPGLILALVIFLSSRKQKFRNKLDKWFFVLLALGLSGAVPIMISLKQRGFYMLATFPIFSMALAILVVPRVHHLLQRINVRSRAYNLFRFAGFFLLAVSLFLITIQYNQVERDREMIGDVNVLMEIIPRGATVAVPSDLWGNWSLHAYLQRFAEISLDSEEPFASKFLLVEKGYGPILQDEYIKYPTALQKYDLYTR